jgi:hypothetical protein
MAMSRPISGELLRLLSYHLIHNCLICTDSIPTLRCGARKPGLLTELLLRLTHRGTDFDPAGRPRSATVVIRKRDGGVIGT